MSPAGDTHTAHLMIRASAGTGKTHALSSRYLKLLAQQASPSSILATTFTRAAAGQITQRILERLANACLSEENAQALGQQLGVGQMTPTRAQSMLTQLVGQLHQIQIATLDSFFNRIGQTFMFELGLPLGATVVDDRSALATQIRLQAIDAMLGDENLLPMLSLLRRLHYDQTKRSITGSIDAIVTQLYDVYRQTDADAWHAMLEPPTLDREQLVLAIADLREAGELLPANKHFANAWSKDQQNASAHDWQAFLSTGLSKCVAIEQQFYQRKEIPQSVVELYWPLVEHAIHALVGQQIQRTAALYDLMARFDTHYTRLRHENKLLLYSDIPHMLVSDLPRISENLLMQIYYRLDGQIQHLMLDEFQDTSIQQWQILLPIAQEIRAHAVLDPPEHTFFCVGDIKQAIYGWRGGCGQLFDQVTDDLQLNDSSQATLNKSYRSAQVVLDAVNCVFQNLTQVDHLQAMGPLIGQMQDQYQQHVAAHTALDGWVTLRSTSLGADDEQLTQDARGGQDDDGADDQADGPALPIQQHEKDVAAFILSLHQKVPTLTVGVLVTQNKYIPQYLHLLHSLGLPASGLGGNPLTDDPGVNALLALLKLADHPGDTASGFCVLNSPLGPIVQLHSIGPKDMQRVSRTTRQQLVAQGYSKLLGRLAAQLAPSCHASSCQRLVQLVQLADAYDAHRTLRTSDFISHVQKTLIEQQAVSPISVMTIHKSKGLEFDVVVLPCLEGKMGQVVKQQLWAHRPAPVDKPTEVYASINQKLRAVIGPKFVAIEQAYQQELARRVQDDLCALYVAMTRARQGLALFVKPLKPAKTNQKSSKKPAPAQVTHCTYADILRQTLVQHEGQALETDEGSQVLYKKQSPDCASWLSALSSQETPVASAPSPRKIKLNIMPTHTQTKRTFAHLAPSDRPVTSAINVADLLNLQVAPALLKGSVIHHLCQHVDWLDADKTLPTDAKLLTLASSQVPHAEVAWLDQAVRQFKADIVKPGIEAVFQKPEAQHTLWREKPFAVLHEGKLLQGIFDRVVICGSHAHVYDYKTDAVTSDQQTIICQRYQNQLQLYRSALSYMLRLPQSQIKTTLVMLSPGVLWEVDEMDF